MHSTTLASLKPPWHLKRYRTAVPLGCSLHVPRVRQPCASALTPSLRCLGQGDGANQVAYRLWVNLTTLNIHNWGAWDIESDAEQAAADASVQLSDELGGGTVPVPVTSDTTTTTTTTIEVHTRTPPQPHHRARSSDARRWVLQSAIEGGIISHLAAADATGNGMCTCVCCTDSTTAI